jgi:hypothetical protein
MTGLVVRERMMIWRFEVTWSFFYGHFLYPSSGLWADLQRGLIFPIRWMVQVTWWIESAIDARLVSGTVNRAGTATWSLKIRAKTRKKRNFVTMLFWRTNGDKTLFLFGMQRLIGWSDDSPGWHDATFGIVWCNAKGHVAWLRVYHMMSKSIVMVTCYDVAHNYWKIGHGKGSRAEGEPRNLGGRPSEVGKSKVLSHLWCNSLMRHYSGATAKLKVDPAQP